MARRPTASETTAPALASLASAAAAVTTATDVTNRGGTVTSNVAQPLPRGPESMRAVMGLLLPQFPTTMPRSQTIASGYSAVWFGTLTIPADVTLTVDGFLALTNVVYTS